MNLFKYDEWKDTDAVQLSIWFLDAVMQEYIDKAKNIPGFESAVRFAEKSRALGLGVLGWHSLLQKNKFPFDSFEAMMLNAEIFRHMQQEAKTASMNLAKEYKWMKVPQWRHVQVDGDYGFGGRLRDKIDECITKLNR